MPKEKPRRKWPEKNTDEYSEKRSQNNVAVRKSREKARQKQHETKTRVDGLKDENQKLEQKVEILQKELAVLKDLFQAHASGVIPPKQADADAVKLDFNESDDPIQLDHVYSHSTAPTKKPHK